jgi:hypothetical protein
MAGGVVRDGHQREGGGDARREYMLRERQRRGKRFAPSLFRRPEGLRFHRSRFADVNGLSSPPRVVYVRAESPDLPPKDRRLESRRGLFGGGTRQMTFGGSAGLQAREKTR